MILSSVAKVYGEGDGSDSEREAWQRLDSAAKTDQRHHGKQRRCLSGRNWVNGRGGNDVVGLAKR